MCGIVGVVRRRSRREPPDGRALVAQLDAAVEAARLDASALVEVAALVEAVDRALRGVPGVRALLADPGLQGLLDGRTGALQQRLSSLEADLDDGAIAILPADLEALNAALVRCRDAAWAVRADRLRTAREVAALAGPGAPVSTIEALTSVQVALSALDRLEVRGRDSAGLHVLVRGHGLGVGSSRARRRARRARRGSVVRFTLGPGHGGGRSRSSTRPQPRSASSATTPRRCVRRSRPTRCCAAPSPPTPRRRSCSGTRAGRVSASSRRRTRTR